jgi:antitoxin component of RelBE/YafQ-DinJ toxin-antitoxin module
VPAITDNDLPVEPEIPNAATDEAIEEARQAKLPTFDSVADLMSDLSSRD